MYLIKWLVIMCSCVVICSQAESYHQTESTPPNLYRIPNRNSNGEVPRRNIPTLTYSYEPIRHRQRHEHRHFPSEQNSRHLSKEDGYRSHHSPVPASSSRVFYRGQYQSLRSQGQPSGPPGYRDLGHSNFTYLSPYTSSDKGAINYQTVPEDSYYSPFPQVQVHRLQGKTKRVDVISSLERSHQPTNGVYRTYGRGQAVVPYSGATLNVPRTAGSHKAHKATITTRVFDPPEFAGADLHMNDVITRSRRNCAGCPKDEAVVTSKGNTYVILPHPCAHRWQTKTGPKPGTKISEGYHHITGIIDNNPRRFCEYRYQVEVRRCAALKGETTEVSCSADNAWGSKCNFTCTNNRKLFGSSTSECQDNLLWSTPEPRCVESRRCLIPRLENGTKLNCETNEISDSNDNYLPEGAFCRIKINGEDSAIKCRGGQWKKLPKGRKNKKGAKRRSKKDWPTGVETLGNCEPNPCLNGGSCLFSTKALHSNHICMCRPNTEGPRCEFTECEENPCHNSGRCLQVNQIKSCFCPSNVTGNLCENKHD